MKILVTGAAGTVGREVVGALLKRDVEVRIASRGTERARAFAAEQNWDVDVTRLDYGDETSVRGALEGVTGAFLVTPTMMHHPETVLGPFLETAKEMGVEHIVRLSGMRTLTEPSKIHRKAERLIEVSGLPHTHLRPNFFMQNFSTFYAESIKQGGLYLPAGDGRVSFIDTRDIGEAAATVFTEDGHKNRVYTLTGGEALTHGEVADVLSDVLSHAVRYVPLTDEQTFESMRKLGRSEAAIAGVIDLYRPAQDGSAGGVSEDTKLLLGRSAIPFRRYAEDYTHVWSD